jgi:hypothetical protein
MPVNSYTVAEINRAWERTMTAASKLPDGLISPATIHLLMELFLGSVDNSKEDNQQAMSARN